MNHRYEIVITNDTRKSSETRSPIAGSNTEQMQAEGAGQVDGAKVAAVKGLAIARTYITPFVKQVISHNVATVSLRTGAEELEQRMEFTKQIGESVAGAVMSGVMGFIVGNLPGAIIGVAVSAITTGISYANKAVDIDMGRQVEDVGLRFMNARAGGSVASFSGSRTKNQ